VPVARREAPSRCPHRRRGRPWDLVNIPPEAGGCPQTRRRSKPRLPREGVRVARLRPLLITRPLAQRAWAGNREADVDLLAKRHPASDRRGRRAARRSLAIGRITATCAPASSERAVVSGRCENRLALSGIGPPPAPWPSTLLAVDSRSAKRVPLGRPPRLLRPGWRAPPGVRREMGAPTKARPSSFDAQDR
jgi:hypothetical protein